MAEKRAVEIRHDGRTYRADCKETLFRWAKEHRISKDDSYRIAGTEKWIPVVSNNELRALLDPDNWWKVTMGEKTYIAPDWEAIVRWAKEGRLSTDVRIEGPKTPPGGILGKASPELEPHLREALPAEPDENLVRLRFDQRTYIPGDVDTLRKWIRESRVPKDAQVSIQGDNWQPISDCGYFESELWPAAVEEVASPDQSVSHSDEEVSSDGAGEPESMETLPRSSTPEVRRAPSAMEDDSPAEGKPYRIRTSYGEDYVFQQAGELRDLLKRKRVHPFDEIRHPDLPDGKMFVSEFLKTSGTGRKTRIILWVLAALFSVSGAAALIFQKQDAQWMMIGGISCLVVAFLLIIRVLWKK